MYICKYLCFVFFYFPSDGDCDSDFFRAATLPKLSTQGSALLIPSRRVGHLCSAGPAQGDLTSGQRPPSRVGHQVTVCDACKGGSKGPMLVRVLFSTYELDQLSLSDLQTKVAYELNAVSLH